MKKKKKIFGIIVILICVCVLIPKRTIYQDGGTIEYKSLIYKITKYHQINSDYQSGYKTGIKIEILGFSIYENIAKEDTLDKDQSTNEISSKVIKIKDDLYYIVEEMTKNFNSCSSEFAEGKISSHVLEKEIPTENNQSNFEGDYEYQRVNRYVVKICSDNTTMYFERKRKGIENLDNIPNGEVDMETDFIQDLYDKVNPSEDASILKEMYETKEKFSNKYVLSIGIVNWIVEQNLRDEEYIDQKDVEDTIHKILGYDVSFAHQDIYVHSKGNYDNGICGYWYRPNSKQYQLIHGCGGNWTEYFKRNLISAEKESDYLYLKEKSIYIYNEWNDYYSKKYIYNNLQHEKLLDYIETDSSGTVQTDFEKYLDNGSTYIYVFRKQNNEYILEDIKKAND